MCTVACSIVFRTFQLNLAHIDIDTHCMPCMHGYMILPLLHSKRQNSERGVPSQIMMDTAGSYSYFIYYTVLEVIGMISNNLFRCRFQGSFYTEYTMDGGFSRNVRAFLQAFNGCSKATLDNIQSKK